MINGLTAKAENLKELSLSQLGSYNYCQISNAIYLIRCFPNLQWIGITLVRTKTCLKQCNNINYLPLSFSMRLCSNLILHHACTKL